VALVDLGREKNPKHLTETEFSASKNPSVKGERNRRFGGEKLRCSASPFLRRICAGVEALARISRLTPCVLLRSTNAGPISGGLSFTAKRTKKQALYL